jgi:uncharacterized repeat protein (TIGR04076 family)
VNRCRDLGAIHLNATGITERNIMSTTHQIGFRVVATIKEVKGYCHAGHQVGDQIELDPHRAGELCGFLYHDVFPYLLMLQFGGGFPPSWGDPDVVEIDCIDRTNTVTVELRRIR